MPTEIFIELSGGHRAGRYYPFVAHVNTKEKKLEFLKPVEGDINRGSYFLENGEYYLTREDKSSHKYLRVYYRLYQLRDNNLEPIAEITNEAGTRNFRILDNSLGKNDKERYLNLLKQYYATASEYKPTTALINLAVTLKDSKEKTSNRPEKQEVKEELGNLLLNVVEKRDVKKEALLKPVVVKKNTNVFEKLIDEYEKLYNERLDDIEDKIIFVQIIAFDNPSEYKGSRSKIKQEDETVKEERIFGVKPEELATYRTLRRWFYDELGRIAVRTKLGWVLFSDPKKHQRLQEIITGLNKLAKTHKAVELIPIAVPKEFLINEAKQYLEEIKQKQKYALQKLTDEKITKKQKWHIRQRYYEYEALINMLKKQIENLEKNTLTEINVERKKKRQKQKVEH